MWRICCDYDADKPFQRESEALLVEKMGNMGRLSLTLESENDRIANML
jgi:hypothetical protein